MAPERLLSIIETQNEIAATSLELEAVMALVVQRARELTGACASAIELLEGEELVHRVVSGGAAPHLGLRLAATGSLSGRCVQEQRLLCCEDARRDPRVEREACERTGARSLMCVPLHHNGRCVGVLKVYDGRPHAFSREDVRTMELLSGVIAAHMAHAADFELVAHDSLHDGLTGLPNRRAFDGRLTAELDRACQEGGPLSLCLVDLDDFKAVNDALGHPAGDRVLRAVAAELSDLRGDEIAFRIGGDEFALLLVGVSLEGASAAAARLEASLRRNPECLGTTASTGIATLSELDDPAKLLARADASLYQAKRVLPLARRRPPALAVA